MVNAEKQRRRAIEKDIDSFIAMYDGRAKKTYSKKKKRFYRVTKPQLSSKMNMAFFREHEKELNRTKNNLDKFFK